MGELTPVSLDRLEGVHPDLVKVVLAAAKASPVPFMVVEGVRTRTQAFINYGKGRDAATLNLHGVPANYAQPGLAKVTWVQNPLDTKHLKQPDGFGHAVDLLPAPYDWKDASLFEALAVVMKAAAHDLGVTIRWGGDWAKSPDRPHYEC